MSGSKFEGLRSRLENNEDAYTLVEIASHAAPNQVPKPDLEDDQKRWLTVGICLHTIISPILRTYVQPEVNKLYLSLSGSHKINSQVYPNYMQRYKPTNKELNYEAINNNAALPKLKGGKKDIQKYDYRVKNDVDFSKLFVLTHMAHYTGFDDSCDLSALLGLIINIDKFSPVVKQVAEKMRNDIRNPWAHCNFPEWDTIKYNDCFQRMFHIVSVLGLPLQIEQDAKSDIGTWQSNGIHFLQGTTIGLELLQTISNQTKALSRYVLEEVCQTDACFENVTGAISFIENKIDKSLLAIKNLKHEVDEMKKSKDQETAEIQEMKKDVKTVKTDLELSKTGHEETNRKVNMVTEDVAKHKLQIDELVKYMSLTRPNDKVYFYPPNRIKTFIGREDEMNLIEDTLLGGDDINKMLVICGLGGTGKTSIAIEFSWKYNNFYPGGIFWMSAESNEALEDALQRLAIDVNTVGKDSKETMLWTLKWISTLQERWLLIIDNLDQDELHGNIKELVFGKWRRVPKSHIIITSRRASTEAVEEFGVQTEECITLYVLTLLDSKQFLVGRTEISEEDDSLNLIAEELGGLPLALEQAGAHIKALKCSYGEYLDKFQKRRIKFLKACKPGYGIPKYRTAVTTTWQLNFDYVSKHSKEDNLGNSAVTVMEVASFLYADEIPIDILNPGLPAVCDEDLVECLSDRVGAKQIVEILTRFSLFHRSSNDMFAVHRLVQEVIRANISTNDHKMSVLQCASRMIRKALESTQSPYEALKKANIGRTSLQLWSKLALHANTLKKYLFDISEKEDLHKGICLNIETVHLLQTSAVYHSLFQRQDEALATQDQMLKILTAIDTTDEDRRTFTSITVPLLYKDRLVIQSCITSTVGDITISDSRNEVPLDPESLRVKGNESFSNRKYHNAIQCYTEALTASTESVDARILSNRSLAHLRLSQYEAAYIDANRCIEIDPTAWKAYVWKAYAIAGLMDVKQLPSSWESVGLAAAAVAGHYNKQCLLEYRLKICYPVVRYKIIKSEAELSTEMGSLLNMTYTTLLLKRGRYRMHPERYPLTRSVQIVGIEEDVEIQSDYPLQLQKPDESWFSVNVLIEPQINVHFENVMFPENTAQILVHEGVRGTFYRCRFSNGHKGCERFPNCEGTIGCINKSNGKCKYLFQSQINAGFKLPSGDVGYPGVVADFGGNVVLDKCVLNRCGGGGALSDGEGSSLIVKNCEISNMRQTGIESRNNSFVSVEKCLITNNQFHGVSIGPNGKANIKECSIQGNKGEGLWCGGVLSQTRSVGQTEYDTGSENVSTCVIHNNVICQNGMSGFSLDGGSFDISGNRIFDNWLWGFHLKSRSTVNIANNDIFDNKCGGIRVGINYSSPVIVDGNTIRDHLGPAIFTEITQGFRPQIPLQMLAKTGAVGMNDEVSIYSIPPFVTSRNLIKNNDKVQQHPTQVAHLLQTCCFCHSTVKNQRLCSRCKKASYCSKQCQEKHWIRHKHMCKILRQVFMVEVNISKTRSIKEHFGIQQMILLSLQFEELESDSNRCVEPDRNSTQTFIVKIQSGNEYTAYDPETFMRLYDQSRKLDFMFQNAEVYHLVNECGVLAKTKTSVKKIFCWASLKNAGKILCLHTDNLPPYQSW